MTPTQRTLKLLRAQGWKAQVVEHFNMFARVRQDLFGFIDVLAIRPGETLGVQCTTFSNRSSRIQKIQESELATDWVLAGNKIEVWGWKKVKNRWLPVITKIEKTC